MKALFYAGNQTISTGTCTPIPPQANEVQIKVAYGGVCRTDLHIYHGNMDKRVTMPQIIGHEIMERGGEVMKILLEIEPES